MRAISKAVTGVVVRVCNSINVAAEAVEHSAGAVNYVARVAEEEAGVFYDESVASRLAVFEVRQSPKLSAA
jgi:hypothetical protein